MSSSYHDDHQRENSFFRKPFSGLVSLYFRAKTIVLPRQILRCLYLKDTAVQIIVTPLALDVPFPRTVRTVKMDFTDQKSFE
jgi:hypothetical protein